MLLLTAPIFTTRMMGLSVPHDATPFLSFIGAFVLAVGLSYLYGALLVRRTSGVPRLEAVWLLTAIIRSSVAIFVLAAVLNGTLATGWLFIAIFDGICVLYSGARTAQRLVVPCHSLNCAHRECRVSASSPSPMSTS